MSDQIVVGDKLKVSRDQLAKFIDNHEVIKQFEKLFATVKYLEEVVEELETYIEVGDTDYEFATQDTEMTYIVFDGLTADRTVTVTDAGFDERSRFKIVNKDSTYKVVVRDGTEAIDYWVMAGETVEFYDISNSLIWASGAWETLFYDLSNTTYTLVPGTHGNIKTVQDNMSYSFVRTGTSDVWAGVLPIGDASYLHRTQTFSDSITWVWQWNPASGFEAGGFPPVYIGILKVWHDAK